MNILCVQLILVIVVSYNIITIEAMGLCAFDKLMESLNKTGHAPEKKTSCGSSPTPSCPPNMVFMNCTTNCNKTCQNPNGSVIGCNNNCTEHGGCVCPEGLLWKGKDCVFPEECGCFVSSEIGILTENDVHINDNCTERCVCTGTGEFTCDHGYRCDGSATCDVREGTRQCFCNGGYRGDGENCTRLQVDCNEILLAGHTQDGVYTIHPLNWTGLPFQVYCNMTIDGGGWTVIQRRVNGSIDFYRNWTEYKHGFGILDHEFWLGNEKLFYLTNQKDYELRIDLVNDFWSSYYAKYTLFRVSNETMHYRLTEVGDYTGTTGFDAMAAHKNCDFGTYDRDTDKFTYNCAVLYTSAWWYNSIDCYDSQLNGDYYGDIQTFKCNWWNGIPDSAFQHCIKYTEMKLRSL